MNETRMANQAFARYDADGALMRPEGYREWVYIGAPLTPNDMNGGNAAFPEFHNVYVDPASWSEYKKSGEFPDGAVIVKELVSVGSKAASSGKGYFMGEFVGLEAAVKDSKRFPKEANGWAYFSFGHAYPLEKKSKAQAQANCAQCHLTAPEGSMVFSQYYPVLRARMASAK
ncbi:MAG: cytochrome P460 family protein [Acidobacteriota bacterium]|nr:cytochrome P460 family protein [Acidobacteriota bacterium]